MWWHRVLNVIRKKKVLKFGKIYLDNEKCFEPENWTLMRNVDNQCVIVSNQVNDLI